MEADKKILNVAYIIVILLAINGAFSFWNSLNSNNLKEAVQRLDVASENIESIQDQLVLASSNVDSIKVNMKKQILLIRSLDQKVNINYEQIEARFNQKSWTKRQAEMDRVDALRQASDIRIDSIMSSIKGY